jgi:hypothetical protein
MNSLRNAQDFLRALSLWLDLLQGSAVRKKRAWHAGGSIGGTMTPVIFITIGFLSCWFLLYALMEWSQDRHYKSGTTNGEDKQISHTEHWNQRVVNFRSKERL